MLCWLWIKGELYLRTAAITVTHHKWLIFIGVWILWQGLISSIFWLFLLDFTQCRHLVNKNVVLLSTLFFKLRWALIFCSFDVWKYIGLFVSTKDFTRHVWEHSLDFGLVQSLKSPLIQMSIQKWPLWCCVLFCDSLRCLAGFQFCTEHNLSMIKLQYFAVLDLSLDWLALSRTLAE